MKNKHSLQYFGILSLFLSLVLCFTPLSLGRASEINLKRMQRDLEIMEGVLNKLLGTSSFAWGPHRSNVRGIYFEGYGVIFQVDAGDSDFITLQASERALIEVEEKLKSTLAETKARLRTGSKAEEVVVVDSESHGPLQLSVSTSEKQIEKFKNRCTEFLGTYADAIGQLDKNDRITVLINLNNNGRIAIRVGRSYTVDKKRRISLLEVSAKKSDIIDYRHGQITETEFRNRLSFNERAPDKQMQRNVDVMAQIMDTALSRKYQEGLSSQGKNRGTYVKGLGVLFFIQGEFHSGGPAFAPMPDVFEKYLEGQEVSVAKTRKKKSKTNTNKVLEKFKKSLVEIVGDYGHTLRTLPENEHVVVAVDFERWTFDSSGPNRFIMMATKNLLDRYNRGEIKLAEFQQKVEFQEY